MVLLKTPYRFFVRCRPPSSRVLHLIGDKTPNAMETLCIEFENVLSAKKAEPLIVIPMFILDFLCIHPFNDGNGRMSRLLTLLILYRLGYG